MFEIKALLFSPPILGTPTLHRVVYWYFYLLGRSAGVNVEDMEANSKLNRRYGSVVQVADGCGSST